MVEVGGTRQWCGTGGSARPRARGRAARAAPGARGAGTAARAAAPRAAAPPAAEPPAAGRLVAWRLAAAPRWPGARLASAPGWWAARAFAGTALTRCCEAYAALVACGTALVAAEKQHN